MILYWTNLPTDNNGQKNSGQNKIYSKTQKSDQKQAEMWEIW